MDAGYALYRSFGILWSIHTSVLMRGFGFITVRWVHHKILWLPSTIAYRTLTHDYIVRTQWMFALGFLPNTIAYWSLNAWLKHAYPVDICTGVLYDT